MCSENPVNNNFQQFDIDNNKTYIYDDMQNSRNRALGHLTLAQCHAAHHLPAFCRMVAPVNCFPEADIAVNFPQTFGKKPKPCQEGNHKNDTRKILHSVGFSL